MKLKVYVTTVAKIMFLNNWFPKLSWSNIKQINIFGASVTGPATEVAAIHGSLSLVFLSQQDKKGDLLPASRFLTSTHEYLYKFS